MAMHAPNRPLGLKSIFSCRYQSLQLPTLLKSSHTMAKRQVLVNSGVTDNFILENLLNHMKIGTLHLAKPRAIWNIDATLNKAGTIKKFVKLQVCCSPKTEIKKFLITNLGEEQQRSH